MSATGNAGFRYKIIDYLLTSKTAQYPSLSVIVKAINTKMETERIDRSVSERTVQRDIENMRFNPNLGYLAPIEFHPKHRGYYYSEEGYSISKLPLLKEERDTLEMTANMLSRFDNLPMFANFKHITQKIFDSLNLHSNLGSDVLFEQSIQFDQKNNVQGSTWLAPLSDAIRNYRKVRLAYKAFQQKKAQDRLVHPYILKEYKDRWYLIAKRDDLDQMRTYALDRIESVEVEELNFPLDESIDRLKYFKHSYGIYNFDGEEPCRIVLEFDSLQAHYIKTSPLHPTQKVLSENKKSTVVALEVYISEDLIMDLMSFGPSLKVIEPQYLIDEMLKRIKAVLRNYE